MRWLDIFADQVRAFSDEDPLAAYERTDGQPGTPEVDALPAEIERQNLDV